MWELDHKEGRMLKNWCLQNVVLEKTLESPLDSKEIQPVHPKGNQPWIFFGRTDAEAGVTILWPPNLKSWLIGKDPDPGKDWRLEEKGTTEDKMVGWHHRLNGHEFKQTLEDGEEQGTCDAAVHGVTNTQTQPSNWTTTTNLFIYVSVYASMLYFSFISLSPPSASLLSISLFSMSASPF